KCKRGGPRRITPSTEARCGRRRARGRMPRTTRPVRYWIRDRQVRSGCNDAEASMKLQTAIIVLVAGTALTSGTALAQQVGTAAAVNPETRTTPPGGATVVLRVGAHVMHKERIKTTPKGSVQLVFLDRSTLTIAPNSEIVIDEFV